MVLPAPHRTGRRVDHAGPRIAAAACCLALGITACSSDGDAEPEPPPAGTAAPGTTAGTGTSAPGTSAKADDEAAVLEAVDGYWRTWLAANDPPNPDHPDLEKYATGAALDRMRQSIAENKANGTRFVEPANSRYRHEYTVAELSLLRAVVIDCLRDDWKIVASDSDEVVNDEQSTQRLRTTVEVTEGDWKVTSNEREAEWPGIADCS